MTVPLQQGDSVERPSWVVRSGDWLFSKLQCATPSELLWKALRRLNPRLKDDQNFVEGWVCGGLLLALVVWLILPRFILWESLYVVLAAIRVWEIFVQQTNVLLFDPRRTPGYAVRGRTRLVILSFFNYAEVVLWTATFYYNFTGAFHPTSWPSRLQSLYDAVRVVSGWGDVEPKQFPGQWIALTATMIGIILTIVVIARVVALISVPRSVDPREQDR